MLGFTNYTTLYVATISLHVKWAILMGVPKIWQRNCPNDRSSNINVLRQQYMSKHLCLKNMFNTRFPANHLAPGKDAGRLEFHQRIVQRSWQQEELRRMGSNGCERLELQRRLSLLRQTGG